MATRKKKKDTEEVVVTKGSHLTVTTYPDGRTELEWDDAALERDVKEAIAEYELSKMKPAVKAKSVKAKKPVAPKAPAKIKADAKKAAPAPAKKEAAKPAAPAAK